MPTGEEIVENAERKLGQGYIFGARVPLNDPAWPGPWDCAEYCSWAVYQTANVVYGCTDDDDPPDRADAWTESWKRDVLSLGIEVTVGEAATIKGAMLLRRNSDSGHIVISNGDGQATLEARGRRYGVVRHIIAGRRWDYGVLVPGIEYDRSPAPAAYVAPFAIYADPRVSYSGRGVEDIQRRLAELGFYHVNPTGIFDDSTAAAVREFQLAQGLTPDGEVAQDTAQELQTSIDPAAFERVEVR